MGSLKLRSCSTKRMSLYPGQRMQYLSRFVAHVGIPLRRVDHNKTDTVDKDGQTNSELKCCRVDRDTLSSPIPCEKAPLEEKQRCVSFDQSIERFSKLYGP